jgi:transcriptional regulator with XRE-family HTH domain
VIYSSGLSKSLRRPDPDRIIPANHRQGAGFRAIPFIGFAPGDAPGILERIVELLDKAVIGDRIKYLRKSKGLRQWQMAELLGATQPAVHKYENGILPEVKRLLELARVGHTSIEWILTGRHWENGSTQMERLDPEIYELAHQLHTLSAEDRKILAGAMELIGSAVAALRARSGADPRELGDAEVGRTMRAFDSRARECVTAAMAMYDAVMTTLSGSKVRELHRFGQEPGDAPLDLPLRAPGLQKSAG